MPAGSVRGHDRAHSWGCCLLGHLAACLEGQRPRQVLGLCPNPLPPPAPAPCPATSSPGPSSPCRVLSLCPRVCVPSSQCEVLGQEGLRPQVMRTEGQLALPGHLAACRCPEPTPRPVATLPFHRCTSGGCEVQQPASQSWCVAEPAAFLPLWPSGTLTSLSLPASRPLRAGCSGTRDPGHNGGLQVRACSGPGIQTARPTAGRCPPPPGPLSTLSVGRRPWSHHTTADFVPERCCWVRHAYTSGEGGERFCLRGRPPGPRTVFRGRIQDGAESQRQ